MKRLVALMSFAFAFALAGLVASARGDDGQGIKLRLKAFFAAKDEDARKAALDALADQPVPVELDKRTKLLREALGLASRKPLTRTTEPLALGPEKLDGFVVTPKAYDEKKTWPAFVSLFGHGNAAHREALYPFTLPPEVLEDLQKVVDEYVAQHGGKPGRVVPPKANVPLDDQLVLAPTFYDPKNSDPPAERVETVVLELLERAARTCAIDQDRVVLGGLSLGAAFCYEVACRHPDRFAGVVAAAGGSPGWPLENLRPLQVYVLHGDKDDEVPVRVGREMDARLKECGVTHVYAEIPGMRHEWPPVPHGGTTSPEGQKVRSWIKARVRTPWPAEVHQQFDGSKLSRRVFWVEVPEGTQAVVEATAKDNAIDLKVRGARSLVLHLGEPLVDLDKEVVVRWGENEVFRGKVERSWKELLGDLDGDGFDLPRAAPARLEVKAP